MKKEKKSPGIFKLTLLGVLLNLCLSAAKFFAGAVSRSVTVTADGWNNLTDAGTTAVTMFGVWAAGCGAGRHHPFGHGRLEWILGMLASASVITVGFELLKSSAAAVYKSYQSQYPRAVFAVLLLSVFVKLWMYYFQSRAGKQRQSETLNAISKDSLSDSLATSAVLVSALVTEFTSWNIDGWCGMGVAVLILFNGIKSFSNIAEKMIGTQGDSAMVRDIETMISEKEKIESFYELDIHDYGLKHYIISLKVLGRESTVCSAASELAIEIEEKYSCSCVVQAGIQAEETPALESIRTGLQEKAGEIHPLLKLDCFRFIRAGKYILITADISIPISMQKKQKMIFQELYRKVQSSGAQYKITFHSMIENNHIRSWRIARQTKKTEG